MFRHPRLLIHFAPLMALALALAIAASCAKAPPPIESSDDGGGDNGGPDSTLPPGPGDATPGPGNGPFGGDGCGGPICVGPDTGSDKCVALNPCTDFPKDPVITGTNVPMNAPTLFGDAGTGTTSGGPCLAEPADGALFPKNWLRPRILWIPASSAQTLFEVRIHIDGEANDYVVYTDKTAWAMPKSVWQAIAYAPPTGTMAAQDGNLVGRTLTVTVRATGSAGGTPAISNTAHFTIAPAIADGALVFWSTNSFDTTVATNTTLQGFTVGDEGTATALTANQVQQQVRATPLDGGNTSATFQQVYCIGCHTATPDGKYVAFSAQWPWPSALASLDKANPGLAPPWLGKGAAQNLSPNYEGNAYSIWYAPPAVNQIMLGIETFSPAHYATGDRMLVATLGSSWNSTSTKDPGIATGVTTELAWFNLEWENATTMAGGLVDSGLPLAPRCTNPNPLPNPNQTCVTPGTPATNGGWGIVKRNGDPNGAGAPSWSHNLDGKTDILAYSSTNTGIKDGRMDCSISSTCMSDIYTVPYASNGPGLGGAGGTAAGLSGASDSKYNEYYPAWSPDDQFIAFDRVAAGTSMYNQPKAEVYVVPYNAGAGGTPVRLAANDPVACTGVQAGAAQNTWPKWAPNPLSTTADGGVGPPAPQTIGGKTYYWITFSSIRSPTAGTTLDPSTGLTSKNQQIYVAGIVVDNSADAGPGGTITTYPPIYLWNQDFTFNNLIPAWGEFSVPPPNHLPPFDGGMAM